LGEKKKKKNIRKKGESRKGKKGGQKHGLMLGGIAATSLKTATTQRLDGGGPANGNPGERDEV